MSILKPVLFVFCLAAVPTHASADSGADTGQNSGADANAMPIEGGIYLGANLLSDDNGLGNSFFEDQVPGSSGILGLRGTWRFLNRFAAEAELSYAPSKTPGNAAMGRPGVAASNVGLKVQDRYSLFPHYALRPFVVAGVGLDTVFASAPDRYAIDTPDFDPGMHWGLGGEYAVGETPYGVRLDLRQALVAGLDDETSLKYEVHISFTYDFFGSARKQREQLLALRNRLTHLPDDLDGDCIPNADDQCPDDKEVFNGIDDADGCPEVDSDGDGIVGSADRCPDHAEDLDGFEDADGCPDEDNDSDGFADANDTCPLRPETTNGFEDLDGCPDEVPEQVQLFTGVIHGIHFEHSSAEIRPESTDVLDAAVKVFKEYEALRIEVSGHTDPIGSEGINSSLSRRRADAVKWYLVDHGIEAHRIATLGYGASKPVADNESEQGRAKNRRIEFRLQTPEN
ncbi:MAG: OmpA family protein [Kofleriaceae bacterium]|nr:OmpA family protein [Kofleriaceae bacterium]